MLLRSIAPTLVAGAIALGSLSAAPTWAADGDVVATGMFAGASGHTISGTVQVTKSTEGYVVSFGSDFRFDGAPDPKLGFGKDGYVASSKFGELNSARGQQSYVIPAGIDAAEYDQVWIWCEKYDVPLAVAELN